MPADELNEIHRRVAEITTQNERLFQRLLEGERRFRRLARAVWRVQEQERRKLALELHDGIGQTLTALINHLQRVSRSAGGAPAADGLAEAIGLAELALADVRELSRLLRPPVLDDLGLQAAVAWLARTLSERVGLRTAVDWRLSDERLDPDAEMLIFRVVQEALNNIVKHSGQLQARLTLRRRGDRVEVEVADPGRGFEPAAALAASAGEAGLGLRGMRDRVELFGGRFDVDAAPGRGSRLLIDIPIRGAEQ